MRKSKGERQKQRNSIGKRRKMQSMCKTDTKTQEGGTGKGVTRETGEKSKRNRRGRQRWRQKTRARRQERVKRGERVEKTFNLQERNGFPEPMAGIQAFLPSSEQLIPPKGAKEKGQVPDQQYEGSPLPIVETLAWL